MTRPTRSVPAFGALRRALLVRRVRQLDPVLRLELLALAALVLAFLFWQERVPLDGLAYTAGAPAVARRLGLHLGLLVGAGALAVAGRQFALLTRTVPGPEWLALPIAPSTLAAHLTWEASAPAWLMVPPALAMLSAAWALVSPWALLGLLAAFAGTLALATWLASALAFRLAALRTRRRPGLDRVTRVLERVARGSAAGRRPAPRYRREGTWRALWRKDVRITLAPSAARMRLLPLTACVIASLAAWSLPIEPLALRRALAFALALLAAGTLADWLVALSGSDPFAVLRVLPVDARALWTARAASASLVLAVLLLAHAAAARDLSPVAARVFAVWTGVAGAAIAALGVNYGVTMFPRADLARRLLMLTLGLAMVASLMIPLTGWALLLTGVIHSSRRLRRWSRLEETA